MLTRLRFLASGRCLGGLCLFTLLAAAVMLTAPGEAAEKQTNPTPTLEQALVSRAKDIRDFLWCNMKHREGALHIGVVKFLAQVGDQKPSANAGPLNWYIARRLEAALILTLSKSESKKFRVLHIDNPQEQLHRRANHLNPNGRKEFFLAEYPPAWGDEEKIPADVFLTGLVRFVDEARNLEVTVQAFDSTGKELVEVSKFKVAAQPRLLGEAGVSFALSRGGDGSNPEDLAKMARDWNKPELPPGARIVVNKAGEGFRPKQSVTVRDLLDQSPIGLQILYLDKGEDKPREIEIKEDGTVEEPKAETKVTFRLWHKKKDEHTYGVVLRINGENTIYPDVSEPEDFRAHKWVLGPKDGFNITGFLKKKLKDEVRVFTALPKPESRRKEVDYGLHAGTFTFAVFLGRPDGQDEPDGDADNVRASRRGVPDQLSRPISLEALQGQLRDAARSDPAMTGKPRGLIEPGEPMKQEVDTVPFHSYRLPVIGVQLRYYKPGSQE